MSNPVELCHSSSNISWRSLSVTVNAMSSDDSIEWFKVFSCKKDGWTKAAYMVREMSDDVKFRFIKPPWSPTHCGNQKMIDSCFKSLLYRSHELIRMKGGRKNDVLDVALDLQSQAARPKESWPIRLATFHKLEERYWIYHRGQTELLGWWLGSRLQSENLHIGQAYGRKGEKSPDPTHLRSLAEPQPAFSLCL